MKSKIILFVLILHNLIFSQSEKIISGQLICNEEILQGIVILNLVTEKETVSDFEGRFSIAAKPEDLLVIQSNNFDYVRKIIDDADFKKGHISLYLTKKVEQLEEVKIVNYPTINAVSLGVLSQPAKVYTVAERRLFTAQSEGGVGQLINYFSGRTKMLKRYAAFEKIEIRSEKLSNMFDDTYYITTLNIPEDKIRAFQNFAAEDASIIEPLKKKNKFLVAFALVPLAKQFVELQNTKPE